MSVGLIYESVRFVEDGTGRSEGQRFFLAGLPFE